MNEGFRNRWLMLAGLLILCLILAVWNRDQASAIIDSQQKQENVRRIDAFLRRHSDKIPLFERELERTFQKVENRGLAILYLERDLLQRAARTGMDETRVNSEMRNLPDQCAEIRLESEGSLFEAARLIEGMEQELPYLRISRFSANAEESGDIPSLGLTLEYRCRVEAAVK